MTSTGLTAETQFSPDGVVALSLKVGAAPALQRIADRMRVAIPDLDNENPICLTGNELQTGRLSIPGSIPRLIYFGGDHGRIVAMLSDAAQRGVITFPLRIVNFDFHADVDAYTGQHIGYTASWQRLGLHLGLFDAGNSVNVRPPHSDAPCMDHGIVTDLSVSRVGDQSPFDVVSIDLDYFSDLTPNSPAWTEGVAAMRKPLSAAKVAVLISSPGWTSGHLSSGLILHVTEELLAYCRADV